MGAIFGFVAIALISLYYGFKLYKNRLLKVTEHNTCAFQLGICVSILMVIYALLNLLQLKVQKKGLAIVYGVILVFTFLVFVAASGGLFFVSRGFVREEL